MTEAEEQFIQVGTKDMCCSPSIGAPLKFVSSNVNIHVTKYGFLTLCRRVGHLIKYPLVPERFKCLDCSTP
jgi:hypothetical protein